ncbi:uncharacterized protein YndB with AHSA1/START domain [Inhella inkyongensis]|uniref:Uncharacterized protein YndB with AHSA1/START domain n=1 Tax=Inhella inkyongensis TaxID=392593 RepID=A0A840RZI0_9BURK|nr:SRPBCC family protein [Inhella inkyongensis]MBB5202963.1 uncharacterized protein YndB with AHSA1/START domain [Inhella inkyongensis]
MPQTLHLQRVLRAPPAKVYKAFVTPKAMEKFLPPYGFTAEVHELDARVGGRHRASFTNFGTGSSHSFGGEYLEVNPGQRLRYTDRFDDPNLPGDMLVTLDFFEVVCGTELCISQTGIPDVIPLAFCRLGWQETLDQLARLVEPEIPDGA